jgi:5-(aminomethyl)-3-furanmethanol phosphate kinase
MPPRRRITALTTVVHQARGRPWVLKLGGSLASAPVLDQWLALLDRHGGRAVVVPGGGPFANLVRDAQRVIGYDNATAHEMALLAMEQYALVLANRARTLRPVATKSALRATLRAGATPVWLPSRMLAARDDAGRDWDTTSDSLAAWLAAEIGAALLVLVKRRTLPMPPTARALARNGVVDAAFPAALARCACECRIVGADDHAAFARMLRGGAPAGVRVTPGRAHARRAS